MVDHFPVRWTDPPESTPSAAPRHLCLPDADIVLYEEVFAPTEREQLCAELLATIAWTQERIRMYGQDRPLPRLTAWYGDPGTTYTYSHIAMRPHPWTVPLLGMKARVEQLARSAFNSVLLNLYRHGHDSVAWHQDNEPELGPNPVIASVSLGGTRCLHLRHTLRKDVPTVHVDLPSGSLLVMRGATQHVWQHRIPKTATPVAPRINLTFRFIRPV